MDKQDVTISVVIVNYNTRHLLDELFSGLKQACEGIAVQIIVVDNASKDQSVELLRSCYPDVELIANASNVGFGRANNQALPLLRGKYVLLLNTDAFVAPDTLRKTVACMETHPDCGVLGVRLVGRDGVLQPSCRYFPTPWNGFLAALGLGRWFPSVRMIDDMDWDHASLRECDWVPGCYYLMRRAVIDQVGLFDPRYFLYYEEVDHCRAVKQAGWKVLYFPDTQVIHIGGESAKSDHKISESGRQVPVLQIESELLFFRKHLGLKGVLLSAALALLADALVAIKGVIRRFDFRELVVRARHAEALLVLLGRTSWGRRATR
jgi:N-acetylglucosaminyl-diphospho-decaprenol L-rhamnosyltransferase